MGSESKEQAAATFPTVQGRAPERVELEPKVINETADQPVTAQSLGLVCSWAAVQQALVQHFVPCVLGTHL